MGWNVINADDNTGNFMINVLGYAVFGDEDGVLTVRVRKIPGFTVAETEADTLAELGLTARHEAHGTLNSLLGFEWAFQELVEFDEPDYSLE